MNRKSLRISFNIFSDEQDTENQTYSYRTNAPNIYVFVSIDGICRKFSKV